jgi:hypothetical protein
MNDQVLTVQLKIDDSSLYFEGLDEMLSRHLGELCSKGNFGPEFVVGIYRALADRIDEALRRDQDPATSIEGTSREGFSAATSPSWSGLSDVAQGDEDDYGDEPDTAQDVSWAYRDSDEARKISAIFDKHLSFDSELEHGAIGVLLKDILPHLSDLQAAETRLLDMAEASGLRVESDSDSWKEAASVDEILKDEGNIIFRRDTLTDYAWTRLVRNCVKQSVIEASDEDISCFVSAYARLPAGFRTARCVIDNNFPSWVSQIRKDLDDRLRSGMFVEDIRAFGSEYGLSDADVPIKKRVEYLERIGQVSKGRKNGKVFYQLSTG